jgi:hypothetical protein
MNEFISTDIWPRLRAAARQSRWPAAVAVAYLGKGATRRLPLPKGSCLVVDASEGAVKSGQTCPEELKKLAKKGVRVFSWPALHAKVYVIGKTAFIGSANVSRGSEDTLFEAMLATTDPMAVRSAREFVHDKCLDPLGPQELQRLGVLYRPPRVPRGRVGKRRSRTASVRPGLPRLLLAQLKMDDPPAGSEEAQEAGERKAKKRMDKPRSHELEELWHRGKCPYGEGDLVVQVLDEGNGRPMVSPAGKVVHIEPWSSGRRKCTFIFLELPRRRRMSIERLAKRLGRGALKRLQRGGLVRRDFAARIQEMWQR